MADIIKTMPFWFLGIGGVLIMLFEVLFNGAWPRALFAGFFLIAALLASLNNAGMYLPGVTAFNGMIATDTFFVFTTVLFAAGTLLILLLTYHHLGAEGIESPGEFYALLLMSTAGAVMFANASELITMFLGLEIMSMALYCLCGAAIGRRESTESALKYFLLGSFSSAFLLYGVALLYGLTGSTFIHEIAPQIGTISSPVLYFSLGLILVGFAFKIGVVPFHFWAPDVYQGAPTSITAYMACVIKASAVAAAIRVVWGIFPDLLPAWSGFVWTLSMLTIVLGNLVALRQRNVKRMLAYSSIAHAGYMMAAFLVPSSEFGGGPAILFYLVSYTAMTLGAFAVLMALGGTDGKERFNYDISSFNGLGYSRPFYGAVMALFMLTLAGLPPGMAGLLGKVYVFSAAVKAGYVGLAIIGMCGSTVSCYYYLRVIVAMYFMEPASEKTTHEESFLIKVVSTACATACIVLGIFPSGLYNLAAKVIGSL